MKVSRMVAMDSNSDIMCCMGAGECSWGDYVHVAPRTDTERREQRKVGHVQLPCRLRLTLLHMLCAAVAPGLAIKTHQPDGFRAKRPHPLQHPSYIHACMHVPKTRHILPAHMT